MFLYSLLKSAANAVVKLMSAVIAIAHVLFVSIKSLSVNVILLEYSFGKLKYESNTLPMSGFLESSSVSTSRSPFSLAIFKSYPHSPDKNVHRRAHRFHTGYQIEVGSRNE